MVMERRLDRLMSSERAGLIDVVVMGRFSAHALVLASARLFGILATYVPPGALAEKSIKSVRDNG